MMDVVYRYTDLRDGFVKYVGRSGYNCFKNRIRQHEHDEWFQESDMWEVAYITVQNKAESEALESHFISYYQSDCYFNRAKKKWGTLSFAPKCEWKIYKNEEPPVVPYHCRKLERAWKLSLPLRPSKDELYDQLSALEDAVHDAVEKEVRMFVNEVMTENVELFHDTPLNLYEKHYKPWATKAHFPFLSLEDFELHLRDNWRTRRIRYVPVLNGGRVTRNENT